MKKKWMMFRSEATNHYYLYNGENVIDITPGEKIVIDGISKLTEDAYNNPRKKIMIGQFGRYPIVARGEFLED